MKLRQSLANFKRPKLDENFTLKPTKDVAINLKPSAKEHASELSTSMESMEDLTEDTSTTEDNLGKVETKTAKPKTSLGIVEMHNDNMGNLGSLCFRKSLPGNYYDQNMYRTSCNMTGGKLRKIYRGTDGGLLSARRKSKDLLVRCESIMIYPKVLTNHKEQGDKLATNNKQQSEKYKAAGDHREQSDSYKVVANLPKHPNKFATKPEQPKEAWNEDTIQSPLGISIETPETNPTHLPQLNVKEETTQPQNAQSVPETPLDNPKLKPVAEAIQNLKRQSSTDQQMAKNSASTKIIIPFGENELINNTSGERSRSKHERSGGERVTKTSLQKAKWIEASTEKVGENDEHLDEKGTPRVTKGKCLKESSKVNEKSQQGRRHSDITLDVRQAEMARKLPVAPQYLTLNTLKFPLKRFRIPTGFENELFVGRENYPPKTRTHRFPYGQKGFAEHTRTLDGVAVTQQDNDGHERQRQCLKIGGKGLLKASLSRNEVPAEDESKKRVKFLVHNSRYFS